MDNEKNNILLCKSFLLNIASKKKFDEIINQINLTDIEYNVIINRFKNFNSITEISINLNISEPNVYKIQRHALCKIYRFLKDENYINQ